MPALKSRERVSILKSPFSFFGPWQRIQCSFKKLSKDLSTPDKDSGSKIIKILSLNILNYNFFIITRSNKKRTLGKVLQEGCKYMINFDPFVVQVTDKTGALKRSSVFLSLFRRKV